MNISTLTSYASDGAQYWYDAVHGIVFDAGLGKAAIVVGLIMSVLTLALWGIRYAFPRSGRRW